MPPKSKNYFLNIQAVSEDARKNWTPRYSPNRTVKQLSTAPESSLDLESGKVCFPFISAQLYLYHLCLDLANFSCSKCNFSKHRDVTFLHMQKPSKKQSVGPL